VFEPSLGRLANASFTSFLVDEQLLDARRRGEEIKGYQAVENGLECMLRLTENRE
jgi:hypothetical protein